MSRLKKLVASAIKEIQADVDTLASKALEASVTAKAPSVAIPKEAIVVSADALKSAGIKAERVGELAFIAKTMRRELGQESLTGADLKDLDGRFKAIGVTSDITSLLPSGFTGALWHDIQERLVITNLFPYKEVSPGQYDSIATNGIQGFLTSEAVAGTESAEGYITMIYLVAKCMAVVKKSYEALDDSLIALAQEVRNGIIDALSRSIEQAVINGDNSTVHMDDVGTTASIVGLKSYSRAFKGLRKLGLAKNPVDFGGAALTEAQMFAKIMEMQEAGGLYTDSQEASMGNLVLIVDQNLYNKFRLYTSFLTKEKAGLGTLFGAEVASVFDIPVVQTPYLPKTNATGVVDDVTAGNNLYGTCILVNKSTMKYYSTGTPLMETERDIYTQFVGFTGSVRTGFNSIFDRVDTAPNSVDSTRNNIIVGIKVPR